MLGATVTHFTSLPFLGCRQNSQPDQFPRRASQKFISLTVNPKKSRSPQETQMMCSPQVCRCFLKSCLCCVKPSSACLLPPKEFDPTPISLPFPPILFLILLLTPSYLAHLAHLPYSSSKSAFSIDLFPRF